MQDEVAYLSGLVTYRSNLRILWELEEMPSDKDHVFATATVTYHLKNDSDSSQMVPVSAAVTRSEEPLTGRRFKQIVYAAVSGAQIEGCTRSRHTFPNPDEKEAGRETIWTRMVLVPPTKDLPQSQ